MQKHRGISDVRGGAKFSLKRSIIINEQTRILLIHQPYKIISLLKKLFNFNSIAYLCSGISLILGSVVLFGWFSRNEALIQIAPTFAPMQFNTALAFCLFGASTILFISNKNLIGSILGSIGGLLAFLTLIEYLSAINLGIDELFFEGYITVKTSHPGRMSPNTAFGFFLAWIVSFLVTKTVKHVRIAGVISTVVFTLGVIAFEGYLVNIEAAYGWADFSRMAVHTALGFIVLSISLTLLSWIRERNSQANNAENQRPWFAGYAISILLALFLIDLGLPHGVAAGTLYVPLILFGWYFRDIHAILRMAIAASIFMWLGLFLSPQGSDFWVAIINRSVSLVTIWILAYQLFLNKRIKIALEISNELHKIEEERFKQVVESAPNSMIVVDNHGIINIINKQTEQLFDYARDDLIGKNLEILIPQKEGRHQTEHRRTFFSNPSPRTMGAGRDLLAMKKDGTEIQVEISFNPLEVNDQMMVLASVVDVTERKAQEAIIKKQIHELELKNQDLEQFAYIASHDLQEPLRTVSNYLQVIKEDHGDHLPVEVHKYFESINSAIKRMGALVRALLDFSRLGRDRKLVKTNCKLVVKNVLADLDNLIKETNTTVTVNKLPQLFTYKTEFRQLIQNLVSNSIKFRKRNIPCQISIDCESSNNHWEFSIKDNGIGIDKMNFNRIFNIFQRLHSNGKFEGYGIGLANCKKIVELHGGEIWVDSEIKKGSTFYFTISNLEKL